MVNQSFPIRNPLAFRSPAFVVSHDWPGLCVMSPWTLNGTILPSNQIVHGISLDFPKVSSIEVGFVVQQSMAFFCIRGYPITPIRFHSFPYHNILWYQWYGLWESNSRFVKSTVCFDDFPTFMPSNLQDISFDVFLRTPEPRSAVEAKKTFPARLASISGMWCPFLLDLWRVAAGIGDGVMGCLLTYWASSDVNLCGCRYWKMVFFHTAKNIVLKNRIYWKYWTIVFLIPSF